MVNLYPNSNALTDGVVVMRGDERQQLATAVETQRIEDLGAPERLMKHFGLERAAIVMDDIVRTDQHIDWQPQTLTATDPTRQWLTALQRSHFDNDLLRAFHYTGQQDALANKISHEPCCRPMV
jgi:hypothetical protein